LIQLQWKPVEIKSSTEFNAVLLGCYVSPIVTETGYSSWIADLRPYAIIYEAARFIFGATALQQESNSMKELVAEEYTELKINAVSDYGY
jgi:hypothetical protein